LAQALLVENCDRLQKSSMQGNMRSAAVGLPSIASIAVVLS